MKIAKRTLSVKKSELYELFNIPETVEIVGVRTANDGSIEFQLVSAGELTVGDQKVTIFQHEDYNTYRRINLATLQSLQGDYRRSFIEHDYDSVVGTLPASSMKHLTIMENEKVIPVSHFTPATCVTTSMFHDEEKVTEQIVEQLKAKEDKKEQ